MSNEILGIIIVLVLLVIFYCWSQRDKYVIRQTKYGPYHVLRRFSNCQEAADLMALVNHNLLQFMRVLKGKYDNSQHQAENPDVWNMVDAVLHDFNPEAIYENDPQNIRGDTSYTVDKGRAIYMCVRDRRDPMHIIDYNTVMFVMLHEVGGHIGNYNGWGHPKRFWEIFKFFLREATIAGVYTPIDYVKNNKMYCGLNINYQPLFDPGLINL